MFVVKIKYLLFYYDNLVDSCVITFDETVAKYKKLKYDETLVKY